MGHQVKVLVGFPRVMGKVAAEFKEATVVRLGFGLALIPLTDELTEAMEERVPDEGKWAAVVREEDTGLVGDGVNEWAAAFSMRGDVGVVWTAYAGGQGEQGGALWFHGKRQINPESRVNDVLTRLGVTPGKSKDAFDAIGFGAVRHTEDWLQAPSPVGDAPEGRMELDGAMIRVFTAPGEEAEPVALADVRALGEMTDTGGPFAEDWWVVFYLGRGIWFRWPVARSLEHTQELLLGLGEAWGVKVGLELFGSTEFMSRVMWPVALVGEEMVVERGDGQLVVSEVVRGYEF